MTLTLFCCLPSFAVSHSLCELLLSAFQKQGFFVVDLFPILCKTFCMFSECPKTSDFTQCVDTLCFNYRWRPITVFACLVKCMSLVCKDKFPFVSLSIKFDVCVCVCVCVCVLLCDHSFNLALINFSSFSHCSRIYIIVERTHTVQKALAFHLFLNNLLTKFSFV